MESKNPLTEYLESHMLTPSVISAYGLKVSGKQVSIPIRSPGGEILFWKHRMFEGDAKYRYDRGSEMALFNADRIDFDTSVVWIVEGEFDAMALNEWFAENDRTSCAVSSTGGAGSWNDEWNSLLEGMMVIILLDNDDPGYAGSFRLWEKIGRENSLVYVNKLEGFKDVCETIHGTGAFSSKNLVSGESYKWFSTRTSWASKRKVLQSWFDLADQLELDLSGDHAGFARAFRDYAKSVFDREKPRPKRVNPFPQDSDITIERIREVPIDRFVRFDWSNVAPCIFHDDSHPSMRWNPPGNGNPKLSNTVKCYSCGRFGGVIDVVMQLNSCGFVDAVEILKKHL